MNAGVDSISTDSWMYTFQPAPDRPFVLLAAGSLATTDLYPRPSALSVTTHHLAVMMTAGLYETSGDWMDGIGWPGKSGVSGGLVTVAPGNSVRVQLTADSLSQRRGLHLLAFEPAEAVPAG